jgi:hypothetical protein
VGATKIILPNSSSLIQVVTTGGAAPSFTAHASYEDLTTGGVYTPGRKNTSIPIPATTTIVPSPAANTVRNLKTLEIVFNGALSGAPCTLTIQHSDGTTTVTLWSGTFNNFSANLHQIGAIVWTDGAGWAPLNNGFLPIAPVTA